VAVIALFGFVLPPVFDIAAWFSSAELPVITRILKWFSDFLVSGWKIILAVFIVAILSLWIYFSTENWKKAWFRFLLGVPLIWDMTKYYYLVKWCRYMRLMLISWMNYVETFKTLRDVLRISAYQDMIERVLAGLQKWETIFSSIKHESELIPSNAVVLIRVWEETANLQNSLWNILTIYKEELDSTIDRLSKVIEPIMLVFIWAIVAIIATWVFGIIFQLMEWI
jgi:type II secretory pathway component PulF